MSMKAFFSASSRRENVNTAYAQDAASMILEKANALPRHAPAANVADPSLMVKIVDDHTRTATAHMYIKVLHETYVQHHITSKTFKVDEHYTTIEQELIRNPCGFGKFPSNRIWFVLEKKGKESVVVTVPAQLNLRVKQLHQEIYVWFRANA